MLAMPLRTLYGVGQVLGAGQFLCNMTDVSSSLRIELVTCIEITMHISCMMLILEQLDCWSRGSF
ncbi:hypothetical protein BDA96_02G166300 [Sorghum bicolor]|uniref:Uncharacterized protein n=2 Tax=Sorghum bicolor TaxID=4558 RepID=A0A921RME1_SORBI|nr:hypothetical protein BDA96_02G166300 [Sorghum bicolor]KXG35339.1 hypothetical protein SORBI_3002G159800 [Sorghum bicolor]